MPLFARWLLRLGPTNPIAVRLVTNGSRRSRHHYIRIGYLGVLIAVLLISLLTNARGDQLDYRQLAAAGARSFEVVAYLQIALICVLAPVFMAGAIAQEADPRTWDILLTTPLGAAEIVLGNLFGRLFFIVTLILSSLPLFAVTQYFGGVPGQSIFASYLIAVCAALLVGSMAIALAVSRLAGRRAVFAFYIAVVSYIAITFAIDVLNRTGSVTYMTAVNPFLAVNALLDPAGYARYPEGSRSGIGGWLLESPITAWVTLSSGISLLLMVVSTITVRVGGLSGFGVGGSVEGKAPWYAKLLKRSGGSGRTVWHNPIAWRESAGRNDGPARIALRYGFIAMGVLFAVLLVVLVHRGIMTTSQFRLTLLFTLLGELGVISLVAINMAATSVSKEREDGTLDILLTTPIEPAQYLYGKLKGMIAYLIPMIAVPVVTGLIAGGYSLFDELSETPSHMITVQGLATAGSQQVSIAVPMILPETGVLVMLTAVPFVAFCVVVGMLWSLRSRGQLGSVAATVGVVVAVGGLVGLCAWNASNAFDVIGAAIAAASPSSTVFASVYPEIGMRSAVMKPNLAGARVALMIGSVISAAVVCFVVLSIKSSMTKNFDSTVRKLAGMK